VAVTAKLTIAQIQEKLEDMFTFTSNLAMNVDFVEGARAQAARVAAEIAEVLLEIHEINALGVPLDSDDPVPKDPLQ
jgi:hypothetical protein